MASTGSVDKQPSSPSSSDVLCRFQVPFYTVGLGAKANKGSAADRQSFSIPEHKALLKAYGRASLLRVLGTAFIQFIRSTCQQAYKTCQPEVIRSLSSDGVYEHDSLECEEDSSSLELQEPAHRDQPAGIVAVPMDLPPAGFDVIDAVDGIRNELSRLLELRYIPISVEARRFADGNRPRAVSWLVQVVSALELTKETLHCAVSLLDRFVAGTEAHPPETVLQLLALGCLSAAAKHEEVAQHSSDEWVGLAVDADGHALYERPDLHRMEWLLLETVEWRIRVPNTLTFLRQYHAALVHLGVVPDDDPAFAATFKACAEFMAEISMLYAEFLSFGYSTIAVACLAMAEWYCRSVFTAAPGGAASAMARMTRRNLISELVAFIGLEMSDITPGLASCVQFMSHLFRLVVGPAPCVGGAPGAAELGLLAPVVERYRHISRAGQ